MNNDKEIIEKKSQFQDENQNEIKRNNDNYNDNNSTTNKINDILIQIVICIIILIPLLMITFRFFIHSNTVINNKTNSKTNNETINNEIINNDSKVKSMIYDLSNSFTPSDLSEKEKMYVCHAGGKYNELYYTNSKEAFINSYKRGYRLMEADLEYTFDKEIVLTHDFNFDQYVGKLFENNKELESLKEKKIDSNSIDSTNSIPTLKEFKSLKMKYDLHQMSIYDLVSLMRNECPKMILITDTKSNTIEILKTIYNDYPDLRERIIPQIYNREQYFEAKEIGFKNIIYTLYLSKDKRDDIINFAKDNDVFAITMDTSWAYVDLPLELSKINVFTYTHTLNKIEEFNYLKTNGIKGIYTDILFE